MSFGRPTSEELRERRQAEKALNLQALATRPAHTLHRGTYEGSTTGPDDKASRKTRGSRTAETIHKGKLAQLGCMVCRRLLGDRFQPGGAVELHHLREGGWGKGGYLTLMPLCVEHHRGKTGVHGLGTKGFQKHYGFGQADLLRDALALVEAL